MFRAGRQLHHVSVKRRESGAFTPLVALKAIYRPVTPKRRIPVQSSLACAAASRHREFRLRGRRGILKPETGLYEETLPR